MAINRKDKSMAQAPTGTPKRKQQGPRVVKDKIVFMGYKGSFSEKPRFFLNSNDAMEAVLADRDLNVEKITLPKGKPRRKAEDAPVTQAA